jgi:hypothetical protein
MANAKQEMAVQYEQVEDGEGGKGGRRKERLNETTLTFRPERTEL